MTDAPDLEARVTKWLSDDNLNIGIIAGHVDEHVVTMVRDLHTALREAEAKLAAIREFADDLAARGDAIAEANPDHVIHIEQCRQHASMIRAILDGKGELTT